MNIADGVARFTDAEYLRGGNLTSPKITGNLISFKLRVTSGDTRWESDEYWLSLPMVEDSNGHFLMKKDSDSSR